MVHHLIIRVDDLGFSEGVNCGIAKAVHDGLVTSVGFMTNMEAIAHGYELIKDADLALGLHTNICVDKPLTDPKLIPSLVQKDGTFCSSSEIRSRQVDTVDLKEAEIEIEAQLARFVALTGRYPDYFEAHAVKSDNFFQALKNVAAKYDLFYENAGFDPVWEKEHDMYGLMAIPDANNLYDAPAFMNDHLEFMLSHENTIVIFHPGYIDQYLLDHSSYTFIRPYECEFLCSDMLKDFVSKHQLILKKLKK